MIIIKFLLSNLNKIKKNCWDKSFKVLKHYKRGRRILNLPNKVNYYLINLKNITNVRNKVLKITCFIVHVQCAIF